MRPTERELEVLEVLWRNGPSTVRQVIDALGDDNDAGYTSWQKIMSIMDEKGLVSRTAEGRVHRFAAEVSQGEVRTLMAGELLDRVFGGSVAALLQSALATRPATDAELKQVEALLEQAEARSSAQEGKEE